ncbi:MULTISPECIES: FAD-dependent oxidoreductase [Nocardia]|jgi:gamma-glutamylputrescine oxidase|uniref:FAD-dependent oxidoreductase n=1 Tax=Nocardia abscessus TaxID=120957 RepID=UPI002B4B5FC8|nr:FAD-dependent oxidoreductase [Nocardia abscessus]
MSVTASTTYTTFTGWVDPPADIGPPLTENLTCSVVIIGGGVAGMATALRLAQHGVDVVLLESEFCGHSCRDRVARDHLGVTLRHKTSHK